MPEYVTPDVWVKGGLLERKHREAMGDAVWLYLYIQSIVRFSGDGAGETPADRPYTHEAAAHALGYVPRHVQRLLRRLEDGGYVVAARERYGLRLTVTKYQDARSRAAARAPRVDKDVHPNNGRVDENVQSDPPRVDNPVQSDGAQSRHSGHPDRTFPASRVDKDVTPLIRTRAANVSNESNDIPPLGSPQSPRSPKTGRLLTPEQQVVNAWMEGIGRDPYRADDFPRYLTPAKNLIEAGHSADDVGRCTRWLYSEQWRRDRVKPPTLPELLLALPIWIEKGRPAKWTESPKQGGRFSIGQFLHDRARSIGGNGGTDALGGQGRGRVVAAELRPVSGRHGPPPHQLPAPRDRR
jgi:hypothetical protein